MRLRVRPAVVHRSNVFGEAVTVEGVELQCPDCGRWMWLEEAALRGEQPVRCWSLGCDFRFVYDFRSVHETAKEHCK